MVFSAGMATFVLLFPLIGYVSAVIASIIVSLVCTAIVAGLLAKFEAFWIKFLNATADKALERFIRLCGGMLVQYRSTPDQGRALKDI